MFHCCKKQSFEQNTDTAQTGFGIKTLHTQKFKIHTFLSQPHPFLQNTKAVRISAQLLFNCVTWLSLWITIGLGGFAPPQGPCGPTTVQILSSSKTNHSAWIHVLKSCILLCCYYYYYYYYSTCVFHSNECQHLYTHVFKNKSNEFSYR